MGDVPHLVPLLHGAPEHGAYNLLALGLGEVRLYEGTWTTLTPLDLGPIPASVEDMERLHQSEPELQHQHQPSSRGVATFHGHGGLNVGEVIVDKFILEVATGTRERLGAASTGPLYLAAVEEHLPRLQATGHLPTLSDEVIGGSPEGSAPHELLERVRLLLSAAAERHREDLREQLDVAASRGLLATDLGGPARRRGRLSRRRDPALLNSFQQQARTGLVTPRRARSGSRSG